MKTMKTDAEMVDALVFVVGALFFTVTFRLAVFGWPEGGSWRAQAAGPASSHLSDGLMVRIEPQPVWDPAAKDGRNRFVLAVRSDGARSNQILLHSPQGSILTFLNAREGRWNGCKIPSSPEGVVEKECVWNVKVRWNIRRPEEWLEGEVFFPSWLQEISVEIKAQGNVLETSHKVTFPYALALWKWWKRLLAMGAVWYLSPLKQWTEKLMSSLWTSFGCD